jgi:hypothetical protein
MPILEIFCEAIENAIQTYEKEVQKIPVHRQNETQVLRQWLIECKQNKMDSVEFRIKMVDYVNKIPAGFLAFIPQFDSRLRKNLQIPLADTRFSEQQLSLKERTQDRAKHKEEIYSMNVRIDTLTQQLAEERAKDNIQKVNQLTKELELEKQKNSFLIIENRRLEKMVSDTNQQFTDLQKNYDELQIKYNDLLKEQESSSANQNAKSTNGYSPLFT